VTFTYCKLAEIAAADATIDLMDTTEIAAELEATVEATRGRLLAIGEEATGKRSDADKWSKKEILGHLIDSASNNHQRFVRLQHDKLLVMPSYQQNDWVRTQNYEGREWRELVEFWAAYNRHLVHVIRHADASAAGNVWKTPNWEQNLGYLIEDYLVHLRHHVAQILGSSAAA